MKFANEDLVRAVVARTGADFGTVLNVLSGLDAVLNTNEGR